MLNRLLWWWLHRSRSHPLLSLKCGSVLFLGIYSQFTARIKKKTNIIFYNGIHSKHTPSYGKYKSCWKMVQIASKLKTHQRTEMFIVKSHFGFHVLCILEYALISGSCWLEFPASLYELVLFSSSQWVSNLLAVKAIRNYPRLGCPSKLVSIRNNRNWNRNLFRHYPKQNVCFGFFASIPKQRVSMFRLSRNKQKTNRNSLIGSIFCNFLQKMYGFFGFFGFFRFFSRFFRFFRFFSRFFRFVSKQFVSVFLLFRLYTETESFDWSETNRRPTQTV